MKELERLGRYQSVKLFTAAPERLGTDPGNLIWARGAFFTLKSKKEKSKKGQVSMISDDIQSIRSREYIEEARPSKNGGAAKKYTEFA